MNDDWLMAKANVQERPFTSHTPLLGPLLAWFRTQWNNVSTKWYVRPLLRQQNEFNRLLAEQVEQHDWWLITQDREQANLAGDITLLTAQLIQLNRQLQATDERLKQLESQQPEG